MTDDERDEGGQALAAVIIGPNVPWDVLSDAVRERYMRAYEAAVATHERQQMARYLAPMGLVPADVGAAIVAARRAAHEVFTDYPGDPLFGGGDDAETETAG